jgi:hypothetical protein
MAHSAMVTPHSATTATERADLASALEHALDSESLVLSRAAAELGAACVSVLFSDGPRTEVTYSWNRSGAGGPNQEFFDPQRQLLAVLGKRSGLVEADSRLAELLRDSVSPHSKSFLIFPWHIQRRAVTAVFGFESAVPPARQVPESIVKSLGLFALATWSVKEIARLRSELKIVNNRLAGRKSVERAKGILQSARSLSEEQAYEYLRGLSRKRRITLEELAEEVLASTVVTTQKA